MSKKGENIYRRKDGRWEGRCILERKADGRYRYEYVYAGTYQEAKEKLILKKSAVIAGRTSVGRAEPPAGGFPFRIPAEAWLNAMRSQVRDSTYIKYRNLLFSYILPDLGDMEWNRLNHAVLEDFCSRLRDFGGQRQEGLSSKTVSDVISVIRGISRYSASRGICPPLELSSITVRKEAKEPNVLTRKEQEKLCHFLYSELNDKNLGILICIFTGLRLGELCALRWTDISISEQTISVRSTMQRIQTDDENSSSKTRIIVTAPKSRGSIRQIPIPADLVRILAAYRKGRTGYVLTGRTDCFVEPRSMERYFARVLSKAGVRPVNFHTLRHTFATRCVELDFDTKSLSEILGHSNVNITLNRYVHPSMELKRRNMQRLSDLLAVSYRRQGRSFHRKIKEP